jgi:hypothetical protein
METDATEMMRETQAADAVFDSVIEKIGHALARGLADALRELRADIANETRKVGEEADRRLGALQTSVQALTEVVASQNLLGEAVQNQCREVADATAALGERLDRQADALRSMYATYSQRESELEQVVEGLVRLRSHSVCAPAGAL